MAHAASGPENHPSGTSSPDPQVIRIQLQKVLSSTGFAGAERLRRFLQFVVTQTLEGQSDQLKETVIGVEVFERPNFDPKSDAGVRTTASRVRASLKKYYEGPGKDDSLRIELPKGHYIPEFLCTSKPAEAEFKPVRRLPKAKHFTIVLCVMVLIAGSAVLARRVRDGATGAQVPQVRWGRLLAKATSEGGSPKAIRLSYDAAYLAASPDEQKVYATSAWSRLLTVISTKDGTLQTRTLPQDAGPLAVSPDGAKLYIGSRLGGIMVIDSESDLRVLKMVSTAGPVWDLAVTPDGGKLFIAMSDRGVWRALTKDWTARQLTNQGCPESIKIGPDGRTLVVTYQCGGPGGKSGHDSVEFFDTQTEELLGTLTGMPFVGGAASFSPDGKSIVLDGMDACSDSHYDHENCPFVPSHVFHFVRVPERRILKSIAMPEGGSARFIDAARVLVFGSSLQVVNASLYTTVEQWQQKDPPSGEKAHGFGTMALLPNRRQAYVTDRERREILILDAEKGDCAPPSNGLVAFYSGDGVLADVAGESDLSAVGSVQFGPGRVGQAFALDGVSGRLVAQPSGHFRFGYRDSSFALYVKFDSLDGTMAILDRRSLDGRPNTHLAKTPDNRLAFEFATKQGSQLLLNSRTRVLADRWYHIAVTKDDQGLALYVNGVLEDRHKSGTEQSGDVLQILFGATWDRKHFMHGKLDEIMFYDLALTGDEVRRLYEKRESGACRM